MKRLHDRLWSDQSCSYSHSRLQAQLACHLVNLHASLLYVCQAAVSAGCNLTLMQSLLQSLLLLPGAHVSPSVQRDRPSVQCTLAQHIPCTTTCTTDRIAQHTPPTASQYCTNHIAQHAPTNCITVLHQPQCTTRTINCAAYSNPASFLPLTYLLVFAAVLPPWLPAQVPCTASECCRVPASAALKEYMSSIKKQQTATVHALQILAMPLRPGGVRKLQPKTVCCPPVAGSVFHTLCCCDEC